MKRLFSCFYQGSSDFNGLVVTNDGDLDFIARLVFVQCADQTCLIFNLGVLYVEASRTEMPIAARLVT